MKGLGRQRELAVVHRFQAEGWIAFRLHEGTADVAAFRADEVPMLVQVKATAAGPFSGFTPADRAALVADAAKAGAIPVLAHWPPHGKLRLYRENEWPRRRRAVAA